MQNELDYTDYWRLRVSPFDNVPDPRFYVPSPQHEAALQRLRYGIQGRKGIMMLTGEIGCGKTLLSRRVIVGLPASHYDVALVANPALSPSELIGEVLCQFGLVPGRSKADQLRRLNERFVTNARRGIESVLIVDEAQAIEQSRVFEEVRLLTNFQLNDRFLLTVVLIGQPELRHRVARVPQLNQRVAVRAHLLPLTLDETKSYIQSRLAAVTHRQDLFTKEAMELIYEQTQGIGRLINALCDACLMAGAQEHLREIDAALVGRVGAQN